uniref:Uncharacterized protein n=1 Tax=Metallosphaera hakonensis JCM 8857 = DSM 7519 TaxID=1293036 RepID=A0A2U9IVD9_9CREN
MKVLYILIKEKEKDKRIAIRHSGRNLNRNRLNEIVFRKLVALKDASLNLDILKRVELSLIDMISVCVGDKTL